MCALVGVGLCRIFLVKSEDDRIRGERTLPPVKCSKNPVDAVRSATKKFSHQDPVDSQVQDGHFFMTGSEAQLVFNVAGVARRTTYSGLYTRTRFHLVTT